MHRVFAAIAIVGALSIAGAVPFFDEPLTALPHQVMADSIVVEKSTHRMSLFKDGQVLRTYRVSVPAATWRFMASGADWAGSEDGTAPWTGPQAASP
jgi:hypothetical protein